MASRQRINCLVKADQNLSLCVKLFARGAFAYLVSFQS